MNLILDARNEDGTSVFNRNVWDHVICFISIVLYSIYEDTNQITATINVTPSQIAVHNLIVQQFVPP